MSAATNSTEQRKALEGVRGDLLRLAALGFDTSGLKTALDLKLAQLDEVKPTEDDLKYQCTTVAPTMEQHFHNGHPELLHPSTMWPGMAYSLTPGQRKWFGEFTGMEVSRTVTVDWVEKWPGTNSPRAVKVSSNMHVPNDRRGKVQLSWVIPNVARFHQQAQEFDVKVHKVSDREPSEKKDMTKVKAPKGTKSLEDMMKEFGL